MQYAIHFDFDNCAAGNGGKQNTPQRITQGVTEAPLERFQGNPGAIGIYFIDTHRAGF
jgi:hypothetical protein